MVTADVQTAFLNAKCDDVIFIRPPKDAEGDRTVLWQLKRSLYGLRKSPKLWHEHLTRLLEQEGWLPSFHDPAVYIHKSGEGMIVVHVDDLCFSASEDLVNSTVAALRKSIILKTCDPLTEAGGEAEFLGRTIKRKGSVYTLSGDAKLIDLALEELGLVGCKSVATPGVAVREEDEELLGEEDKKMYQRQCGRLLYISQDRPDVQFSTKTASCGMVSPTKSHLVSLKRIYRYLSTRKTLTYIFDVAEDDLFHPKVYCDSDWASCAKTRRSTSGVVVMVGTAVIATYSRTQTTIALSSAEAELTSMTSGVCDLIHLRNLLGELGYGSKSCTVYSDSQAALDALRRGGVGRIKHVSIRVLFLSSLVKNGTIAIRKVPGEKNVSDLLTKHVTQAVLKVLIPLLPFVMEEVHQVDKVSFEDSARSSGQGQEGKKEGGEG
jgi:ribonuclease HI